MKNTIKILATVMACVFVILLLQSCGKNYTKFYEDEDNPELSIFSDKGNNVMSCYINNSPWQTNDRLRNSEFTSITTYVLNIFRDTSSPIYDFLYFSWFGNYKGTINNRVDNVKLCLQIPKRFPLTRLNQFSGQRIIMDTTNGFFLKGEVRNKKIPGVVFFKTLIIDSSSLGFKGKLAGIFEAELGSFQITKGRFDHELVYENFQ